MKNLSLIFLILISQLLLNCSSDDTFSENDIIGEWKIKSMLRGGNKIELNNCEQGEGIMFLDNSKARFIIVDHENLEPNVVQEGFEQCDYRYAEYDFLVRDNNILNLIVYGEGNREGIDDSIGKFKIETLTSTNLRIRVFAHNNGELEDMEIDESKQLTFIYTRK